MDKLNTLLALLRCAVCGGEAVAEADWEEILPLAAAHRVEALLSVIPGAPEHVRMEAARELFRDTQFEYVIAKLQEELTRAGVEYILLRGAVIKRDYHAPELRGMADLDYLVHVEDYPKLRKDAENLGGRHRHTDGGAHHFRLSRRRHGGISPGSDPRGVAGGQGHQSGLAVRPRGQRPLCPGADGGRLLCQSAGSDGLPLRRERDGDPRGAGYMGIPAPTFPTAGSGNGTTGAGESGAPEICPQYRGPVGGVVRRGGMTPELERFGEYIVSCGAYGSVERDVLNTACYSKTGMPLLSRAFSRGRSRREGTPGVRENRCSFRRPGPPGR